LESESESSVDNESFLDDMLFDEQNFGGVVFSKGSFHRSGMSFIHRTWGEDLFIERVEQTTLSIPATFG
jgi:hypothetical protein